MDDPTMFVVYIEGDQYCIRRITRDQAEVTKYGDFRLFTHDLKVRMENEAALSLHAHAVETSIDDLSPILERRRESRESRQGQNTDPRNSTGAHCIDRMPHTYR